MVSALDIDIYSDIAMENSLNAPAASTIVEPETGAPTPTPTPAPETHIQNNPTSAYDNMLATENIDMENSLNAPATSTIVAHETSTTTQSRSLRTVPAEEQPIRSNQYKSDQESIEHSRPSLRKSLKDIQAKMRLDNQRYQKANLVRLNMHGSNRDMPRPHQSSTRKTPRPSPYRREEHQSRRPSNRR